MNRLESMYIVDGGGRAYSKLEASPASISQSKLLCVTRTYDNAVA